MKKVTVAAYGINVQNRENQPQELNHLCEIGLLEIFAEFMEVYSNVYTNINYCEKLIKSENYEVGEISDEEGHLQYHYIKGIIKTGNYGKVSEIVDSNTGEISHQKTAEEAEVLPFHFCIALPVDNCTRGILIIQTIGIFSVKGVFEKTVKKFLQEKERGLQFIMGTLAPIEYVEHYLNRGILKKIRLIQYEVPNNVQNREGINQGVECESRELVLNKPLNFITRNRERLFQCMRGQRAISDVIEVEGFDYNVLKLDFNLGGRTKTIDMNNLQKIVITVDITDEVEISNGEVDSNSMFEALKEVSRNYLELTGLI